MPDISIGVMDSKLKLNLNRIESRHVQIIWRIVAQLKLNLNRIESNTHWMRIYP